MAENQASDNEKTRAAASSTERPVSKDVGPVEAVFLAAAMGMAKLWNAITSDGVLAAAGRQGIDELGAALKAFPDSIQVSEKGTLWAPTKGEIVADRLQQWEPGSYSSYSASSGPPHPWPSEVANETRNQPGNSNGNDNAKDGGYSM